MRIHDDVSVSGLMTLLLRFTIAPDTTFYNTAGKPALEHASPSPPFMMDPRLGSGRMLGSRGGGMLGGGAMSDDSWGTHQDHMYFWITGAAQMFWIVLANIVLLNVLIAMMNATYGQVAGAQEAQWRLQFLEQIMVCGATPRCFVPSFLGADPDSPDNRPPHHVKGNVKQLNLDGSETSIETYFLQMELIDAPSEFVDEINEEEEKTARSHRSHPAPSTPKSLRVPGKGSGDVDASATKKLEKLEKLVMLSFLQLNRRLDALGTPDPRRSPELPPPQPVDTSTSSDSSATVSSEQLQKPALQNPALQKPALQNPALQKPALQNPALQKPASAVPPPVASAPAALPISTASKIASARRDRALERALNKGRKPSS